MVNNITRFRAYQLGTKGASYSYCVDDVFTLIEARYNDVNKPNIHQEMEACGCRNIYKLHITSWDEDHCNPDELQNILDDLLPACIETPGYVPDTDCGKKSKKIIDKYNQEPYVRVFCNAPENINSLPIAVEREYSDVIYNPKKTWPSHNDNSTVKLFRRGRFTLLSLGDCESAEIANTISSDPIACQETDVMILAHHGADNGFTTADFIKRVNPKLAICCSNYDNQYNHPDDAIRNILYDNNVKLCTTKTGDVIVICNTDNVVNVYNMATNNTTLSSFCTFSPKLIIG